MDEEENVSLPESPTASGSSATPDINERVENEISARQVEEAPALNPYQVAQADEPQSQPETQDNVMFTPPDNSRQKSIEATRQQIAEKYPNQTVAPQPQQPAPAPQKAPEAPKDYTTWDYLNALWHENDFYVLYDTLRDQYNNGAIDRTPDPNFNPIEAAHGTWAEGKLDQLVNLHNRSEFDSFIAEGQEHIDNDKILESMGWSGVPVRFLNGMVSPAAVIPGMMGPKAWSLGAKMALGGAVAAGAMEPWYRANDPTRTNEDSLMAISAAAVGSVVLGKGLAYAGEKLAPVIERIKQARGEAEPVLGDEGRNVVVNPPESDFTAYSSDNPFGPEAPAVTQDMKMLNGEKVKTDGENLAPPVTGEMNGVKGGIEVAPETPEPKKAWVYSEYKGEQPQTKADEILQGRELDHATVGPKMLEPVYDKAGQIIEGIARTKAGGIVADIVTPLGRMSHVVGNSIVGNIMENSHSKVARATLLDMADTARRSANQQLGELRTLNGGSIEVEKGMAQDIELYNSIRAVDEAYAEHRFGSADKEPTLRITGSNYWGVTPKPAESLSYEEFNDRVFKALNMGDKDVGAVSPEEALPQVENAAKAVRKIFSDWQQRAQKVTMNDGSKLLADELGSPMGAETYAPHIYDPVKIDKNPTGFIDMFYKSLKSQHEAQVASREKISLYHNALKSSDEFIETLNKIIDGGQENLDKLAIQQEEVRRFNKFAYARSADLSAPIDTARANVRKLTDSIQPQLNKLEALRTKIGAEKDSLPHIKEVESQIFDLINANARLKNTKSAFEHVAGAEDLVNHIDSLIESAKGGIRGASENAKLANSMPDAATLKALRAQAAKIRKEIAPYTKAIKKNRNDITNLMASRGDLAKGGAVFETEIRNRGNTLANKESAHIATVDEAKRKLSEEIGHNNNMRELLEKHVGEWVGKSNKEAKAALAARAEAEAERNAKIEEGTYQGRGERLTTADQAVESFARRVMRRTDLDLTGKELDNNLLKQANEIADDIRYSSNNRLNYDGDKANHGPVYQADPELRGGFRGRTVPIPFDQKSKFLKSDMRDVMASWSRTVPTDVIFAEKMGSLDLAERKSLIDNEYLDLKRAANQRLEDGEISKEQHLRLINNYSAQQKIDKDQLTVVAERLRGIHGYTPDMTTNMAAGFARDMQSISTVASLGRAVLSSVVDAGGAASLRWGLGNVFKHQYFPMIRALAQMKPGMYDAEVRRQAKEFGLGIETAMTLMRAQLPEIVQGPGNPFSKSLAYGTSRYMILNGLMPWTDAMKSWGVTAATRVFGEAAQRVANGAHTAEDLQRLFDANIPVDVAKEIGRQYEKHAADNLNIGFRFANIDKWDMTPEAQEAKRYFKMAMRREGNTIVMTPGVATAPIWTSHKLLAPVFQFKSYAWRAHEIMATSNMQNLNMKLLGGYLWAGGLGTLALYLQKMDRGEEFPDDPMQVIKEVSDLASFAPIYSDINKQFSSATNGRLDAWRLAGVDSPYMRAGDRTQIQAVMGPAFGLVGNGINAAIDAASGNATGSTYHNLRKMMPGQNHFLAWPLYDLGEAAAVSGADVKPTKKQKTMMENWGY